MPLRLRLLALLAVALTSIPVSLDAADGRLDRVVEPTFQAIHLRLDADEPEYTGSTRIDLRVHKATSSFRFHVEETRITGHRLTGPRGEVALQLGPEEETIVTATASSPIPPGEYQLTLEFTSPFNTRAVSLYRMEHESRGYSFTQFEADDARAAFPCWDEPEFKIPFQMTISVPEGHEAVTNTPVVEETHEDGWRTLRFARTKPFPTYLLALATGPLEYAPMSEDLGVPGRVVTVAGGKERAKVAIAMTPPLLRALEDWFGSAYPYEKLDFIAIPEYWPGAMEHPGAVTYSEPLILIDEETATVQQRKSLARVIAHELAHMWFGNLVTMEWWDDLWLNESFADWMGDKISNQVFPEFRQDLSTLQNGQRIMGQDARPSTEPIRKRIRAGDNLMEGVGLAYNKGKAVLAMMERWLGPAEFRAGVHAYLEDNAWGNATAGDLWRSLDRASDKNVSALLSGFVEQPGFPLVTIEPLGGRKVRLSQQRFRNYGASSEDVTWSIPIALKVGTEEGVHTESFVLDRDRMTVRLEAEPAWIYPNLGGVGYYRWSVPPGMLGRLAANAVDVLSPGERIEFLGNVSALLDAGAVDGEGYLTVLNGFARDPEPLVINSLLGELDAVETAFVPAELEESFAVYIRHTLGPALERIGLEPLPGEDETAGIIRPRLVGWLGDAGRDETVRAFARERAARYLEDPSSLPPSLVDPCLRLALQQGDEALFETYRLRFENAQSPTDRRRFLGALGSVRTPELMRRALDYVLTGPLRPNEMFAIPGGIGDSRTGEDLVFRWTLDHYEEIVGRLPPEFAAFMPFAAGGCDPVRLEEAKTFFSVPEHAPRGTDKQLAKVADQVKDCVTLREREGDSVARFMERFSRSRSEE